MAYGNVVKRQLQGACEQESGGEGSIRGGQPMRTFDQELRRAISAAGYDLKGAGPATTGNEDRTMAELARRAKVSEDFISRLKSGKRKQVVQSVAAIVRLATALGITVESLVAGENAALEAPVSSPRPSSRPRQG